MKVWSLHGIQDVHHHRMACSCICGEISGVSPGYAVMTGGMVVQKEVLEDHPKMSEMGDEDARRSIVNPR